MMKDVPPIIALLIMAGAIAGSLTAIFVFVERTWQPVKGWLQDALTTPLVNKLDDLEDRWRTHEDYVRYHLGPNGDATPVHARLQRVEEGIEKVQVKE